MNDKTPVILRGLVVLETMAQFKRPAAAAEIIEKTQLSKPTIHRILIQLESAGYIYRHALTRTYTISHKLVHFAFDISNHEVYKGAGHNILKQLSIQTNETCNCTIFNGRSITYYDRVEANWPLRLQLPIGSELPIHCTASGKLFLAYLPKKARLHLLNSLDLKPRTAASYTDATRLYNHLRTVRSQGYSLDNEEFYEGTVAIAVPVFRTHNNVRTMLFTVAIQAPNSRKTIQELMDYLEPLKAAAKKIEYIYKDLDNDN